MAYTFEQLSEMTVAQLREIANGIEHEAVKGAGTMHKEKLLPALCLALGIEAHKHHEAVGVNKGQIKAEIRLLKKKRDEVVASAQKSKSGLSGKEHDQYKAILRRIHHLKTTLRRSIV